MKIYFHLCLEKFTNCYVVVNDDPSVMEALIIDPGKISKDIINQIEKGGYKLTGVLITHDHESHVHGLTTLCKIYSPYIYAANSEIGGKKSIVIRGDGNMTVAGLDVQYLSVPGHSSDSMVYKIGNVLFTGDTLFAGTIGGTSSQYSNQLLKTNIMAKLLSQNENCIVMPGHGPPSTISSEKKFNTDLNQFEE